MSGVIIAGDTSGSVTLQAPAVSGTTVLTLPATTGTVALTSQITSSQWTTTGSDIYYSTGNVGIGTSSPAAILDVASGTPSIYVTPTTQNQMSGLNLRVLNGGNYGTARIACTNTLNFDSNMVFYTNGSNSSTLVERMRIDYNGNLLVGCTSAPSSSVTGTNWNTQYKQWTNSVAGTGTSTHWAFVNPNGGVGSIQTTNSTTAYNTSSDYRLKENIIPMVGALDTVSALKPVTYTWKTDGSNGQGFIAHELQEVVPDAVTGEKDAVNEDGSIKSQGIDTSFLVATLTAAIQELAKATSEQQALIENLTTRLSALENK